MRKLAGNDLYAEQKAINPKGSVSDSGPPYCVLNVEQLPQLYAFFSVHML